jgi:hypothetical protein
MREMFSKWINHHLKTVVESLLSTHMKDSIELQRSLTNAFPNGSPPNAKLFSADAAGMHANIDTAHGLKAVSDWLFHYKGGLPTNFTSKMINAALKLIMTDNTLQFGNILVPIKRHSYGHLHGCEPCQPLRWTT